MKTRTRGYLKQIDYKLFIVCMIGSIIGGTSGYLLKPYDYPTYVFDSYQHPSVQAQVFNELKVLPVREADKMMGIAYCESRFQQYATHANRDKSVDRGVFMWNSVSHKEVSDEYAFNIKCATDNAVRVFKQRGSKEWACSRILGIK